MDDDFDNLVTTDAAWLLKFEESLDLPEDNSEGQLALWPLDDLIGPKRYVACPRRGTHLTLVECWCCWNDVVYGKATA